MRRKEYSCQLCNFVNKKIKDKQRLYEDDKTYVMLDNYPISRGHALVIPKNHVADITQLNTREGEHLGRLVAKVSKALRDSLDAKRVYVVRLAEDVMHFNFELIPVYKEDADRKGFCTFLGPRRKLENPQEIVMPVRQYLNYLEF